MRGECESNCLNLVKDAVFCRDGQPLKHPLTHKSYVDVSKDEFERDKMLFINSECRRSYFGLLEKDRDEFENILRIAQPNAEASKFPDFVFENGFIEHFQITSSLLTRKGATHTKKEREFFRKVDVEKNKIECEWNQTPSFDRVRSASWSCSNPTHSHKFLINSFKNNWEHHMKSYKKYTGLKEIGIFMVEYPEFALAMHENVYHNWIDGMSHGDMREQETFKDYRLSRDKTLLEYIYEFRDSIKYVIFVNYKRFEVIQTKNIPYLISIIPWDYVIYPLHVITSSSLYNISVPGDLNQNEETNSPS